MERLTIRPIHDPEAHRAALDAIDGLMALEEPDEAELAMLETLAVLVERYEERVFPLDRPSPLEAIRFRMDQLGLSRAALAARLGLPRSRISEVLNGQRSLSIEMIRLFHEKLQIPADILISREPPSASS